MEIVDLDQLTIHTETKDITLSQLKEMVDANDIMTNPDYQRNYVYDDKRASLLVESILIYDSIIIPFSLFSKRALMMHADKIRTAICDMREHDVEYRENVYVGTNAGRRVRSQITKVINIINQCIGQNKEDESRCFAPCIREELFLQKPICAICGNKILSLEDSEVDHIIPFSRGGATTIENAQLTHRTCNRMKSNYMVDDSDIIIIDIDDSDDT